MATIVAITSCPTGIAHTFMAAEGLEQAAVKLGHTIKVETQGSVGAQNQLNEADVAAADIVVIAADTSVDLTRFAGKRIYETSTKAAINDGAAVIQSALKEAAVPGSKQGGPQRIVAITSCPTGIAHTFMAAEGLQHGATKLGHTIKVETQGSVGAQNALTPDDVAAADIVLIAADTTIDKTRFAGKRIYETSTKAAINDGAAVVQEALAKAAVQSAKAGSDKGLADQALDAKAAQSASRTGVYKHLMTGVSYMIPFVVAGGLLIALGFALGGIYVYDDAHKGTLAANLFWIGKASFQLMVPILAGYAAFSIADRPGIAPGMIAGVIADSIGAGFLGGIVGGFIAGYTVRWLSQTIRLPRTLDGLKPVLILPLLGATITGLLMYYVVGGPVASILATISAWLKSMQGSSAIVLGMLLGSMMAFDMGGPVNKAAYTFGTGLLASQIYEPMAAIMAAGMTPPARHRPGDHAVPQPLLRRRAGSRQGSGRAGHLVHYRGRHPVRRQGPAAGDPVDHDRFGDHRGDLDGCRRATARPARRHLRPADAECRIGIARLHGGDCRRDGSDGVRAVPAEEAAGEQRGVSDVLLQRDEV
jgi:PTS system fructose-specific IIC component